MEEFKGTNGKWERKPYIGVTSQSNPLFPVYYNNVCTTKGIGGRIMAKCLSKDKEELVANAKLISKAPQMLKAMNDLVLELDKLNHLLPKENEDGGNLIWDRIQTCRSLVKNVLK